jgi:U3 small nucleolar ribonucleoprotein protein LCP5
LVLVTARRALGDSLTARTSPPQSFSSADRGIRGNNSGDLIDTIIENRIVLEKLELLESKMRYQIEKLVRIADEPTQRIDGKLFPIGHELSLIVY